MSHHYLECKDIFYSYPDGNTAVDGISFRINHGESVAIVGENGAGKSTLLNLFLGIIMPTGGEINIGGTILANKTLNFIRQRIGLVFQNPDDQLFMPNIYDDIAFGPRNYRIDEKEIEKRVNKCMELMGITHLKDRASYKLSGGEKRSAAIATVLAMNPDILLMDEPSSALDPKSRRKLIKFLQEFIHTKIIATHDMDMVWEVCDRTIILNRGKVIADGKTKDMLIDASLLDRCGLEVPMSIWNCPSCGLKKIF